MQWQRIPKPFSSINLLKAFFFKAKKYIRLKCPSCVIIGLEPKAGYWQKKRVTRET